MRKSIFFVACFVLGGSSSSGGGVDAFQLTMKTSASPPPTRRSNAARSPSSFLKTTTTTRTRTRTATTAPPPPSSSVQLRGEQQNEHYYWGAGVESMFSTAKTMRKNNVSRLQGVWKNRRRTTTKPWKKIRVTMRQRRHRQRKQQRKRNRKGDDDIFNNNTSSSSSIQDIDLWGVEKAREGLSLPSWACCNDIEEERRLAAMKIILQHDLEIVQSQTIDMPNGRSIQKKRKVVDVFPDVYSDLRLLRFLRKDQIQDPVTAAVRYSEFLSWRRQHNIDSIRAMVETESSSNGRRSSPSFQPPSKRLQKVGELLPCLFHPEQSQKDGVVPVLLQVGSWDSVTITKLIRNNELSLSTFLEYWIYMFESLHKHLYEESIRTQTMVQIDEVCDLKGMDMSQFSPLFISTVMKPWLKLTQSNYPETAKRIIILNPPNILFVVWKMVTPLASPGTVAKVSLNSKFKGTGKEYYQQNYETLTAILDTKTDTDTTATSSTTTTTTTAHEYQKNNKNN